VVPLEGRTVVALDRARVWQGAFVNSLSGVASWWVRSGGPAVLAELVTGLLLPAKILKRIPIVRFVRLSAIRGSYGSSHSPGLPDHFDENFSGFRRIIHFSQECNAGTAGAIFGF
jgi:hypothetical protein